MSHPARNPICKSALIAGILALSGTPGCTAVRSLEDTGQEQSVNQCEASSDCRGGRCVDGRCVALQGEIEKLLLEVVPPMLASDRPGDGASISSVRYLVEQELPENTGEPLQLDLRPIVHVTGSVDFSYVEEQGCRLDAVDSVVLEAQFTPSELLLGLAATTYTTSVELDVDALEGPVEFSINVPPGYYDIYLKSVLGGVASSCQPTPRFIRRKPIGVADEANAPPGDQPVGDVHIPFTLAHAATLNVAIEWPEDDDALAGWTVAMVDSYTGLLISGEELIQGYDNKQYNVPSLRYTPVEYASGAPPELPAAETELVRLAPPNDANGKVVAPTLYVARIGLELIEPGGDAIKLMRLPKVVSVVGQVRLGEPTGMACDATAEGVAPDAQNACAVPFTVQIVSTSNDNQPSTFNDSFPQGYSASYQTSVETEADLRFLVDLPVGEYRAIAIPAADDDRPWAIGEDTWILGDADPEVHGKTVSVSPRTRVTGRVLGAGSGSVGGFTVNWAASPTELPTTILEATRRDAPVPRATSVSLDEQGHFIVAADAGVFNMTVKPEPESGFAWLVRPNISVLPFSLDRPSQALSDMRLPLPVRYHGSVNSLALGGVVPDALIRAYVYLDEKGALTSDAADASAVIQVGEARADADGKYQLLLPSDLALDP